MGLQALFAKIIETKVVGRPLKSLWEVLLDDHLHHGHLQGLQDV